MATSEHDLKAIQQELVQTGYIKHKKTNNKKEKNLSKPLHFVSSDGFDIFVGKNNIQNEELTFKVATGNDWWFHSKTFPVHVIVKLTTVNYLTKLSRKLQDLPLIFQRDRLRTRLK